MKVRPGKPANQSAVFAFSVEKSKIGRMFAGFVLPEGTGESQIRPSAVDLSWTHKSYSMT